MQVDTSVSESDVGSAKVGPQATFTVEAFPGRTFTGTVAQIREAPITVQNVVTYNVVVTVDNADLALLPGMTANTRIITDERDDVLRVPLQALRFSPQGPSSTASSHRTHVTTRDMAPGPMVGPGSGAPRSRPAHRRIRLPRRRSRSIAMYAASGLAAAASITPARHETARDTLRRAGPSSSRLLSHPG